MATVMPMVPFLMTKRYSPASKSPVRLTQFLRGTFWKVLAATGAALTDSL